MSADLEILPVGTRIRHKEHKSLKGRVIGHEWKDATTLSAIPYRIDWDDDIAAKEKLGIFRIWGKPERIEADPR